MKKLGGSPITNRRLVTIHFYFIWKKFLSNKLLLIMKSVFPFEIHRMEIVLRRRNRREFSSGWIARNRSSSSFCMQAGDLSNAMYFFYCYVWKILLISLNLPIMKITGTVTSVNSEIPSSKYSNGRKFLETFQRIPQNTKVGLFLWH